MTAAAVASAVTTYAQDIVEGRIVAGRVVRLACERHLRWLKGNEQGYWFDEDAARRPVEFCGFLRHRKGEFAGQPIKLEPWQEFIIGSMFGWKRADDRRVFRRAWVEVGRKNGKSTTAAAIANYLAFFDGEAGAEVYCAAVKRDQAKIVWDEAAWQIENAPGAIKAGIDVRVGAMFKRDTSSRLVPLGSDRDSTDGLNPHGEIRDELHAWKDRAFLEKLDGAMGSRSQPLVLDITTAGSQGATLYLEQHDYAVQVLEGAVPDDTLFAYIATLDRDDDPFDEAVWIKANPNLGVSKSWEYMREQAVKAKHLAGELNAFLRYQLNVITNQVEAYLTMDVWDAQERPRDMSQIAGRPVYLGIDLSERHDLTALVVWVPDDDRNGGDVFCWFWMPEDAVEERSRLDGVPYHQWARMGLIDLTPGEVVDYGWIAQRIAAVGAEFDVQTIEMDPHKARQLRVQLEGMGFEQINEVQQSFASIGPCIAEMDRLLQANGVRHGNNQVLRWMAGNVAVRLSPDNLMRFEKAGRARRIDGMVALVMAIGAASGDKAQEGGWFVR